MSSSTNSSTSSSSGWLSEHIAALESMKKYPKDIFYRGDLSLLKRKRISIVGSRTPNQYARYKTQELSSKLAKAGLSIVSGGAIGVDALAHRAAGVNNTIMVAATGIDKRYPAINAKLIEEIESQGLVLSQFAQGAGATKYSFVLRNELVVALGEVLIVTYADLDSGTMRSVEFAKQMGKKIYVLPHRIGESEGTNLLLQQGEASAIYDIESFVASFATVKSTQEESDGFRLFCQSNPTYEVALQRFGARVFEAELLGEIVVKNGVIELA